MKTSPKCLRELMTAGRQLRTQQKPCWWNWMGVAGEPMQSLAVVCSLGKASHPTATQGNLQLICFPALQECDLRTNIIFIVFVKLPSSPQSAEFFALFFKSPWLDRDHWSNCLHTFSNCSQEGFVYICCKLIIWNLDIPHKAQKRCVCFTSVTSLLLYLNLDSNKFLNLLNISNIYNIWIYLLFKILNLDCVILVHMCCMQDSTRIWR